MDSNILKQYEILKYNLYEKISLSELYINYYKDIHKYGFTIINNTLYYYYYSKNIQPHLNQLYLLVDINDNYQ
jgi:hypothetical protein